MSPEREAAVRFAVVDGFACPSDIESALVDALEALDAERAAHAKHLRASAEALHVSESKLAALVKAAEQAADSLAIASNTHDGDLADYTPVPPLVRAEVALRDAIAAARGEP